MKKEGKRGGKYYAEGPESIIQYFNLYIKLNSIIPMIIYTGPAIKIITTSDLQDFNNELPEHPEHPADDFDP